MLLHGLYLLDPELQTIRVVGLNQELKRFSCVKVCMPLSKEDSSTLIIGGQIDDTQISSHSHSKVYEGKTKPGKNSQVLKMSLTFVADLIESNSLRLEFIDEHKKSLVLRNEIPDDYNNFLEIGYEHYLFGLSYSADLVIVEDWKVSKRVIAQDAGNDTLVFTELLPFFNIESFPFAISKGASSIQLVNVKHGTTQTLIKLKTANQY